MGRKPMIAGNWKMYKSQVQAVELAQDLGAIRHLLEDEARRHEVERCVGGWYGGSVGLDV